MATQIIQLDGPAPPDGVLLRPDVRDALVVFCDEAGPFGQAMVARPADGRLTDAHLRRPPQLAAPVATRSSQSLSIVICTHERPDDLGRALHAVLAVAQADDEVLVIDNNPVTARTAEVCTRLGVQRIVEPRRGLNWARNAGLAAARRDVVAYVDDDVRVTPFWRANIACEFAVPQVGCVTGLVLPIELETEAQEQFEVFSAHRRTFERRRFSRASGVVPSRADVVGIGANMAFRRETAAAIGGFDTRLDAGTRTRAGGDTDMFARILDAGHDIVYVPRAQVWHRHRRTMEELRDCVFGYGAGTFAMLTKRVVEGGDLRALETAARWLVGTTLKAVRLRLTGAPAPPLRLNAAEWSGALCGPLFYAMEAWSQAGR